MKITKISTALATAALATTLLAPTAQALQPGDKYVALGDSYASTGTITQPVLGSTPACVKDQDNYGPDPRKVDTSGVSYAAWVSVADVSASKVSGA